MSKEIKSGGGESIPQIDNLRQITANSNESTIRKIGRFLNQRQRMLDLGERRQRLLAKFNPGSSVPHCYSDEFTQREEEFGNPAERIRQKVTEETTVFDVFQETGVMEWIQAGCPDTFTLPHGTTLTWTRETELPEIVGEGRISADYYPDRDLAVVRTVPRMNRDFYQYVLEGHTSLQSFEFSQHEGTHSLHFPRGPEGVDWHVEMSDNIVEPFAARAAECPVDLYPQQAVFARIWENIHPATHDYVYDVQDHELRYGIEAMDTLFALYSIDPDIGSQQTVRQTAAVIIDTAQKGNVWENGCFVSLQDEINSRMRRLGIRKEDRDKLVARYRTVRKIQRTGAVLIAREELAKIRSK